MAPDTEVLARCFKKATRDLESFAKKENMEMWSQETVRLFWRKHRGSSPECAVMVANVRSITKGIISIGLENFEVTNPYDFKLNPTDTVYIHHHVIVEVESATAK